VSVISHSLPKDKFINLSDGIRTNVLALNVLDFEASYKERVFVPFSLRRILVICDRLTIVISVFFLFRWKMSYKWRKMTSTIHKLLCANLQLQHELGVYEEYAGKLTMQKMIEKHPVGFSWLMLLIQIFLGMGFYLFYRMFDFGNQLLFGFHKMIFTICFIPSLR